MRATLVALALVLGVARLGAAQTPAAEWGQIHATTHHPVAKDRPVEVRPLDDRPADVQLARRFAEALRHTGRPASAGPTALVLSFETEIERVPQTLQRGIADTRGRVKFLLLATLDDPRSGQRLWSGQASYLGLPNQETTVFAHLAQLLVDEIGKTSRLRGFTLE